MADWWIPDFSLTSGSSYSGGGQGLTAPAYTPSYDSSSSYTPDYSLSSSGGGGGGQGLTAPTYTPSYDNSSSYTPSYSPSYTPDYGVFPGSGSGGGAPSFRPPSGGGAPTAQQGGGATVPMVANAQGGVAYDTTAGASSGPDFGVSVDNAAGGARGSRTPAMLSLTGNGSFMNSAGDARDQVGPIQQGRDSVYGSGNGNPIESGLGSVGNWVEKNALTARLGLDLTGMLLARQAGKDANRIAQQQMDMQRAAQQKNTANADKWNEQATASANEARSLYNPQEMAVRGMAQQQMANQRGMLDSMKQMQKAGKSKATIDAEMRRAKLAGTTGATTAYMAGLDKGRAAQQSALASAKGLSSNYNTTADYTAATMAGNAGLRDAQNVTAMLNTYLGNPVYQTNAAALRRAQNAAYY